VSRLKEYLIESSERDKGILRNISKECSEIIEIYRDIEVYLYRGINNISGEMGFRIPRRDRLPKDTPIEIQEKLDIEFKKKFGWKARSEGVFVTPRYNTASTYGTGYPVVVFPVNGFKYLWSPVYKDLYADEIQPYIGSESDLYGEWEAKFGVNRNGSWEDENHKKYNSIEDIPNYHKHEHPYDGIAEVALVDDNGISLINVTWIPRISWEEYNERKINDNIKSWVSTYKYTDLIKAIKRNENEIMIKCEKYYWMTVVMVEKSGICSYKYKDSGLNPNQLSLEF